MFNFLSFLSLLKNNIKIEFYEKTHELYSFALMSTIQPSKESIIIGLWIIALSYLNGFSVLVNAVVLLMFSAKYVLFLVQQLI